MTHTNEFLRGMFSAYMGCEVQYKSFSSCFVGTPFTIGTIGLWVSIKDLTCTEYVLYKESNPKPILTPPSEITDEDAVEVAKIFNEFVEDWGDIHCIKYGKLITKGIGKLPSPYLSKYIELTDYLRSPYRLDGTPKPVYDCGYMHIPSLIQADLAISSKQI